MQSLPDYFKDLLKHRKGVLVVMIIYILLCLASAIYFMAVGRAGNGFTCIFFAMFVFGVFLVENWLDIAIPPVLLLLLTFIPLGSILGTYFDFFVKIPWFDDFLHCISGFIYACVGFGLFKHFVGEIKDTKKFLVCLLGGISFSLAIGVLWEIYEFAATLLVGKLDMEEDTLITSFHSYYVSGTHKHAGIIDDITKTEIFYGDGLMYTIEGGYLDIGLIDTLNDMLVCFIGAIVFTALVLIGSKKKIYNAICPILRSELPYDIILPKTLEE